MENLEKIVKNLGILTCCLGAMALGGYIGHEAGIESGTVYGLVIGSIIAGLGSEGMENNINDYDGDMAP